MIIDCKSDTISLNPNPEEYTITYKLESYEHPVRDAIIGFLYKNLLTFSIDTKDVYKSSIMDFFILREFFKDKINFKLNITDNFLPIAQKFLEHRFNILDIKEGKWNDKVKTNLRTSPYEDQKSAIAFFLARRKGINCSSVGVGKTFSALGTFNSLKNSKQISQGVIFCLNENKLTWYNEILKHTEYKYKVVRNGSESVCNDIESFDGDLIVLHYDCIINEDVKAAIIDAGFDFWVMDEAHVLRNNDKRVCKKVYNQNTKKMERRYEDACQRANTLFDLQEAIKPAYVLLLTGTPIPEDPIQAYPMIKMLQPTWVPVRTRFEEHFCNFIQIKPKGSSPFSSKKIKILNKKNKYKNLDQLKFILDTLCFRRTQDQCKDFPPTTLNVKEFDLDPAHQKYYNAIENKEMERLKGKKFDKLSVAFVETLRLRQCLSDPALLDEKVASTKFRVLKQVTQEILSDPKNKIVIFSCFRPTLEKLVKEYAEYGAVLFAGINKDLTQEQRDANITRFLNDPSCRILFANSSLGAGGNWGQVARYGIFFDLPEARLDWKQSFGRITRRDAKGTSTIIVFLTTTQAEKKLWNALNIKNDVIDSILGEDQTMDVEVEFK